MTLSRAEEPQAIGTAAQSPVCSHGPEVHMRCPGQGPCVVLQSASAAESLSPAPGLHYLLGTSVSQGQIILGHMVNDT